MINFENTVRIKRSAGEVYDYVSDLEHTPEWNWAITETVKTTPGPPAVGSRYRQTRSVPQPAVEFIEIVRLDPGRLIEVEGTLAGFQARLRYHLVGSADSTDLKNSVELEAGGALRLVSPILGSRIKKAVADNLGVLKDRLEEEVPSRR